MSEKRRDNKGRILKTGESQRKDGRYLYKYVDAFGKTKCVYSWKLVPTDSVPKGKRDCLSLREMEHEIHRDLADGIDTTGKKMTLCQLYAKQNEQRSNVKESTKTGRKQLMEILKKDKLGARSIDSIKPSDAKEWAVRMKANGYAYKTINNYKRSLKASFYIAIADDYVRKNPFDFKLNEVIEDDTKQKQALTEEQEKTLLAFAKTDRTHRKYYDEIVILLKTGLRISDDDDKIRLNQRKPSKYKGLRRFGPEKNLQRINKFMKERPIFYKNLIQMKENIRFYLRCFYCITKVMILQFNSENRTELARNG